LKEDVSSLPVAVRALASPGAMAGSLQYMAPELLESEDADSRSDIFSLGAMLYEMATGRKPFDAKSQAGLIAAVLREEPRPMRELQPALPLLLERIVKTCLAKDPDERLQNAHDLKLELDWIRESSGISDVAKLEAKKSSMDPKVSVIILTAALLSLLVATAILIFLRWPQKPRAERFEFVIPIQEETGYLALSADSRMLALVSSNGASGANMISVQHIGSPGSIVLPGTEGASYPFWSPDNANLAYFADGKLMKIAVAGGMPQVIASAPAGSGGAWGRGGVIVYAPEARGCLWTVNADGSNPSPLTDKLYGNARETSHRWPFFLPDGEHFLFFAGSLRNTPDGGNSGIYLSSVTGKEKKLVLSVLSNPQYANGCLFYLDEARALRAAPLDVSKGTLSSESQIIAGKIGFQPSISGGAFSVAGNGTVVYNSGAGTSLSVLTWYDRSGKELGRVGDAGLIANPALSPDNGRVVEDVAGARTGNINIWMSDLRTGINSRFTSGPEEDVAGIWARDGTYIAYRSSLGHTRVFLKQSLGLQPAIPVFEERSDDDIIPTSWSPDNKQILCTLLHAGGGSDLVLIPASGGKVASFMATKASVNNGQISPDGRWVAYASNESGNWEVYATTFPTAAGKWQVSRGGGTEPRWRSDAREIFYLGSTATLTAVPVSTWGTAFNIGNSVALFQNQLPTQGSPLDIFTYDVAYGGQRFLVNRRAKPQQVDPLHIVLNATADLRK
jgi:eukaryotic-like serine/threonine-protein kinase